MIILLSVGGESELEYEVRGLSNWHTCLLDAGRQMVVVSEKKGEQSEVGGSSISKHRGRPPNGFTWSFWPPRSESDSA